MATQLQEGDKRSTATLFRQFEKLENVKHKLIKLGILSGDATPAQVIEQLRRLLPPDIMA